MVGTSGSKDERFLVVTSSAGGWCPRLRPSNLVWSVGARWHSSRSCRTVPVPDWVRTERDDWLSAAAIDRGKLFRRVNKVGRTCGDGMTVKAVWHIVEESARSIGVAKLAPHNLRRTCARLCHASGGELEQIQFLLGHVSVQTTERYLGCKQRIRSAVNDRIGIEPNPSARCNGYGRVAD